MKHIIIGGVAGGATAAARIRRTDEKAEIVLLENCRCNKGEKKNDEALAKKMAVLCDVYANDAFGERGGCGFTFGDGCSPSSPAEALFGGRSTQTYHVPPYRQVPEREMA